MVELLANSGDPDQTPHSALVSVFWFFFFFLLLLFFYHICTKIDVVSRSYISDTIFATLFFRLRHL